jgi:hypothetical protein
VWAVKNISHTLTVLALVLPGTGCATTLKLAPDSIVPPAIVSEWAPSEVLKHRVTIKIEAAEIAVARKYWEDQPSLRNIHALEYPARQMLTEAAEICAKRWFAETNIGSDSSGLLLIVSIRDLIYNMGTDVFAWFPITEAHIAVNSMNAKRSIYRSETTSGRLSGKHAKTSNDHERVTQYTHMIYRALLIAVDKAMVDVILHVPELRNQLSAEDQKWLEKYY